MQVASNFLQGKTSYFPLLWWYKCFRFSERFDLICSNDIKLLIIRIDNVRKFKNTIAQSKQLSSSVVVRTDLIMLNWYKNEKKKKKKSYLLVLNFKSHYRHNGIFAQLWSIFIYNRAFALLNQVFYGNMKCGFTMMDDKCNVFEQISIAH